MKLIILLLLAFVISVHAEPTNWQKEFDKALIEITKIDHTKPLSLGEAYGAQLTASAKDAPDTDTCDAVVRLWMSDNDITELIWWRQTSRPTRALVVALFYCVRTEPISGIPPFSVYANRFRDKESIKRQEEISFVNEHLSAIAAKLTNGIERAKDLHRGYARVAKAGIGSPLPR